uniref:DUF8077 domain-containing protein n=1 Tax=Setaria digitata TaxID=48799 RepID=A0A915Q7C4_9BILA
MIICHLIPIFYLSSVILGLPEPNDPTSQELTLLDWSSGIRVFYCADAPLEILVEPFKQSLTRSLNKFCKNATACRLVKSFQLPDVREGCARVPRVVESFDDVMGILKVRVEGEQDETKALILCEIVLLDGYPRLDYGAVQFRFVIVLPRNAIPLDRLRKPFLTKEILSHFLNTSIKDFERRFGWKVSSYEQFPKFDSITEFMNMALIPIGFILLVLMLLLAYWSSTISRSTGGGDEWFVSGSTGGKNTAMKRTLEIIEEQKILFAERNGEKEPFLSQQPQLSVHTISETAEIEKDGSERNADTTKMEAGEIRDNKSSIESAPLQLSIIASESTSTLGSSAAFRNIGQLACYICITIISSWDRINDQLYFGNRCEQQTLLLPLDTCLRGRRMSRRLSSIDDGNFNIKRHRKKRIAARSKRFTQVQSNCRASNCLSQEAVMSAIASSRPIATVFSCHTSIKGVNYER